MDGELLHYKANNLTLVDTVRPNYTIWKIENILCYVNKTKIMYIPH